jgi:NTP pyrophosphatase (non-canonical NTP hydrolase)
MNEEELNRVKRIKRDFVGYGDLGEQDFLFVIQKALEATSRDFPLRTLQKHMKKWRQLHFPASRRESELQCVLGASEEVGELCHAVLKARQGIRGFDSASKRRECVRDAVGDTVIFLMGVCDANGWQMQEIIEETMDKVLARGTKYSGKGSEEDDKDDDEDDDEDDEYEVICSDCGDVHECDDQGEGDDDDDD